MEAFTIHRQLVLRHEEQVRPLVQLNVKAHIKGISRVFTLIARMRQILDALSEDYSDDFANGQKPNDCENDVRVSKALMFWY